MYRLRETGVLHMRFFDRKKVRLLFGFTVFLVLLILNCVMYCNKAGMKRDLTVVIDVGHGGNDPGKIGVDNVKEKDVNLQIALCLKAQLRARGGEGNPDTRGGCVSGNEWCDEQESI